MNISAMFENNKVIVAYNLTDSEMDILKHLKEHGFLELRNSSATVTYNLIDYGFIELDDDSWHFTVTLTELGKIVIKSME